jgi:tRNA pseudouridine38-40 synthase
MRQAADSFVGFADFRSFTDDDPSEKSTTVKVEQVTLKRDGDLVLLRVVGSHFLWKMVRRLAGVLAEVGRGGLEPTRVPALLSSSSDLPPKLTAPASGLFLERVFYEPPAREWPLDVPLFRLP